MVRGRLSASSGGGTIGYSFTRIDYDCQPNGNRPAIDRPRMVRGPISLAALQHNEGTVTIGLGADITWALALDRSVANDPIQTRRCWPLGHDWGAGAIDVALGNIALQWFDELTTEAASKSDDWSASRRVERQRFPASHAGSAALL